MKDFVTEAGLKTWTAIKTLTITAIFGDNEATAELSKYQLVSEVKTLTSLVRQKVVTQNIRFG